MIIASNVRSAIGLGCVALGGYQLMQSKSFRPQEVADTLSKWSSSLWGAITGHPGFDDSAQEMDKPERITTVAGTNRRKIIPVGMVEDVNTVLPAYLNQPLNQSTSEISDLLMKGDAPVRLPGNIWIGKQAPVAYM